RGCGLVVGSYVREVRQRIPEAGRALALEACVAGDRTRETVVRGALLDVRRPRDSVLVEEVREIGPRVERAVRPAPQRRDRSVAEIRPARARLVRVAAPGRPAGDEPEVRRQAPAPVGLEHVVLEDEAARVRPEVRDLASVVVTHDVRVAEARAGRAPPIAPAIADDPSVGDAD